MLTKYTNHLPTDGSITYNVLSKLLDSQSWKLTKAKDIKIGDIIVDDFSSHYVKSIEPREFDLIFHFPHEGLKRALKGDALRVIPAHEVMNQVGRQLN